jgi:hypothetical protein
MIIQLALFALMILVIAGIGWAWDKTLGPDGHVWDRF